MHRDKRERLMIRNPKKISFKGRMRTLLRIPRQSYFIHELGRPEKVALGGTHQPLLGYKLFPFARRPTVV